MIDSTTLRLVILNPLGLWNLQRGAPSECDRTDHIAPSMSDGQNYNLVCQLTEGLFDYGPTDHLAPSMGD